MALGNLLGKSVSRHEARSMYVEDEHRFIVSFIVGYKADADVKEPIDAAAAALALTLDKSSNGTLWFVHDRKTFDTYIFDQADIEEIMHDKGMLR